MHTFDFAHLVRAARDSARRIGLEPPSIQAPPRHHDCNRTIDRSFGRVVVRVRILGRTNEEVRLDIVEGVLRANELAGVEAQAARSALLAAVAGVAA